MSEDKELAAMTAITKALDKFGEEEKLTIERIIRWAASRYGISGISEHDLNISPIGRKKGDSNHAFAHEDIGELYHATNPKTDPERALVAGYWLMTAEGKVDFASQEANNHLKNLGHGIGNITDALSSLKKRKPALVMQTAKSGKSKQARKKYKLTKAGFDAVKGMITGRPADD